MKNFFLEASERQELDVALFVAQPEQEIEQGIKRLGTAIKRMHGRVQR